MKKILCLIIATVLILSLCACGPTDTPEHNNDTTTNASVDNNFADNNQSSEKAVSKDEDFVANDTDKGYYIVDYVGDAQIIKVPEVLNGKTVEGISYSAFYDIAIEEIYFPSTITEIEAHTFENQQSMKKVVLNEGLKKIGNNSFINCFSLSDINIPSSVEEIGDYAFCGCEELDDVVLSEGLTSIGITAFGGCSITKITFPANLIKINDQSFSSCKNLKDVYVLNNHIEIHPYAFDESENVVLHGNSGSTAEAYAIENEIPFVAE